MPSTACWRANSPRQSKLGAILNELGDVVSGTALYLPFAVVAGIAPLWVVLAVVIAVIAEPVRSTSTPVLDR